MKLPAYAVFDKKALSYNRPFFVHNDQVAKRIFVNEVANPDSDLSHNPEDFILYRIGSYDDQSGELVGGALDQLLTAIDAKRVLNTPTVKEVVQDA